MQSGNTKDKINSVIRSLSDSNIQEEIDPDNADCLIEEEPNSPVPDIWSLESDHYPGLEDTSLNEGVDISFSWSSKSNFTE